MSIYIQKINKICLKNKYTKWYINIIKSARNRISHIDPKSNKREFKILFGHCEMHHILPKSICETTGQIKDNENLVLLTPREHYICHWLLCKMFTEKNYRMKMYHAFGRFVQSNNYQKRILTSHAYNSARKHISIAQSKPSANKGKKIEEYYKDPIATRLKMSNTRKELIRTGKIAPRFKSTKGKIYIHNNIKEIRIFPAELEEYIHKGYIKARLPVVCPICGYTADRNNFVKYHKNKHET